MELHIDIRWLLERQSEVLPKHPSVHDFSNLVAAVARHRVNTPQVGVAVDNAWRAAALMHAIIRLRPSRPATPCTVPRSSRRTWAPRARLWTRRTVR